MVAGSAFGRRWRRFEADEVQFASIEQFPLNPIARIETDGRRQGQRKTDIEPGLLALRTNRLYFQRIGGLHFFSNCACLREARV
jgi:hypothetical protein